MFTSHVHGTVKLSLSSQHTSSPHTFDFNHFIITNYCFYSKHIVIETFLLNNNTSLRFTLSS